MISAVVFAGRLMFPAPQMVVSVRLGSGGSGTTDTKMESVWVLEPSNTWTVYIPVVSTKIEAVVSPVLHTYDIAFMFVASSRRFPQTIVSFGSGRSITFRRCCCLGGVSSLEASAKLMCRRKKREAKKTICDFIMQRFNIYFLSKKSGKFNTIDNATFW